MQPDPTLEWLVEDIRENGEKTKKTIVYAPTINGIHEVYDYILKKLGRKVYKFEKRLFSDRFLHCYYAQLGDVTKAHIQQTFPRSDSVCRVLIATSAYGTGIDIPDVERIVHWGLSRNALCYWQEVGRAGRAGQSAEAFLYVVPRFFQVTGMDSSFVEKMKELGGLCSRKKKNPTKSTQTDFEASTSSKGQPTVDVLDEPDNSCLRRVIMTDLKVKGMTGLSVLDDLACTKNELCQLKLCCSLCKNRCLCSSNKMLIFFFREIDTHNSQILNK